MFIKKDLKSYLQLSSFRIFNLLKFSSRIYILPSVIIYPSNMCNYDCFMCNHAKSKTKDLEKMDFYLLKKIIEDCSKLLIKPLIHFLGHGEPLIYPKIVDAMQLCNERKLNWSMTTNGHFLEKYAEDLIFNNCYAINISIHGNELEHDKTTGVCGSFDNIVRGIRILEEFKKRFKKRNPILAINCVINPNNALKLKNILNTFMKLPIQSVNFQHTKFSTHDIKKKSDFLIRKKDKLNKLIKFTNFLNNNTFPKKIYTYPNIKNKDILGYYTDKDYKFNESCIFPWLSVNIYPNGDVGLCNQFFGSLRTDSLKSVINSKQAMKFRDLVRKGRPRLLSRIPDCFRCSHRHYY